VEDTKGAQKSLVGVLACDRERSGNALLKLKVGRVVI
jgi:hypothetical protein